MASVDYVRSDVAAMLKTWDLIKHCISGERTVKEQGTLYLPPPNPEDISEENKRRYRAYLTRAVFYAVTSRTLSGLIGEVFSKEPAITMPPPYDILLEDADGAGVSITQQSKKALELNLAYGRGGLFVDFPDTTDKPQGATLDDMMNGVRAVIQVYAPWNIINWRTKVIGSRRVLSLVVIKEKVVAEDDGFEVKSVDQFRVLRLNNANIYTQQIFRFENDIEVIEEEFIPLDYNGNVLNEIPFTFFGSTNNDEFIDIPPMYDIASLNIAHFRNSADYEESCYIVGQPTPIFTGLDEDWVKDVLKDRVYLGSRSAISLPIGADAKLLQPTANLLPMEAMKHKESQMVALGAKLIEIRTVRRTATEALQEEASTTSILATCASNVTVAYQKMLKYYGLFMGTEYNPNIIEFELNTDYSVAYLNPNDRQQLMLEWQAGMITFEEMRFALRKANIAYQRDEEAQAEYQQKQNEELLRESKLEALKSNNTDNI